MSRKSPGSAVANGWREVSRSTNALDASVFAVPSDGVVWDEARARGARRGYWRLPLAGWGFPGAGFGWTNGFVWAEGMLRPKVESTRDGLVVLDHGLALAPAANWARYGLDASLFWCRTNTVGGLVGTFLGAAVDDDPAKIVNAQFELFPSNGCVALRYDLSRAGEGAFAAGPFEDGEGRFVQLAANTSEVVLQRVHPNDWDMDGLPNVLDEDPRVPAVVPTRNQSPDWAARAFPGHAAEIASAGGYLAWAAARGGEADRHLVGLNVESPGGVWPVCLSFGDLQVMCDGTRTLYFPVDDGARYPFALSDGAVLASVEVAGEGTLRGVWEDGYEPYEQHAGGVGLRLDSPRSGWVGRTATVQAAPLVPDHFFPGTPRPVSASVTNCHADAYLDCEWRGPSGFSFSNPTSLTTTVEWNGDVPWATNGFDVVTRFAGPYEVTNHYAVAVGVSGTAPLDLAMSGQAQEVYFLNDYQYGNRTERVYRVSFHLQGPHGTRGNLSLASSGTAGAEFFLDEDIRHPVTGPVALATDEDGYYGSTNVFMVCPVLGRGAVDVSFSPENGDGGTSVRREFQVIEPIRQLVTTERVPGEERYLNPSCLVCGTNAVLKVCVQVGENDAFSSTNEVFRKVSGSGRLVSQWRVGNEWYASVEPQSGDEDLVIEARFNNDEVQPRFVLPVVQRMEIPIRAFVATQGQEGYLRGACSHDEIQRLIDVANNVYGQIGLSFVLDSVVNLPGNVDAWDLVLYEDVGMGFAGEEIEIEEETDQFKALTSVYTGRDCVKVYFVDTLAYSRSSPGDRSFALYTEYGIVIPSGLQGPTLAHELGHALGLLDIYSGHVASFNGGSVMRIDFPDAEMVVGRETFSDSTHDWGLESGRGFYPRTATLKEIVNRFLMLGIQYDDAEDEFPSDLPFRSVWGLPLGAQTTQAAKYVKIGASDAREGKDRVNSR